MDARAARPALPRHGGAAQRALAQMRARSSSIPSYYVALDGMAQAQVGLGHLRAALAYEQRAVDRVPLPQYVGLLGDLYRATGNARRGAARVRADRRDREAARGERRPQRPRHRALRRRPRHRAARTRSRSRARATPSGRASSATTCSAGRSRATASAREALAWSKRVASARHAGRAQVLPPRLDRRVSRRPRRRAGVVPARARAQPALLGPLGAGRPEGSAPMKQLVVLAGRRRRAARAGRRAGAPARQLHDQPLRARRGRRATGSTSATSSTWRRSRRSRRAQQGVDAGVYARAHRARPPRHARRPARCARAGRARARLPDRRRRPAHDAARGDPARPVGDAAPNASRCHDTNYADRIGWKEIVVGAHDAQRLRRAARVPEEPPAEPARRHVARRRRSRRRTTRCPALTRGKALEAPDRVADSGFTRLIAQRAPERARHPRLARGGALLGRRARALARARQDDRHRVPDRQARHAARRGARSARSSPSRTRSASSRSGS